MNKLRTFIEQELATRRKHYFESPIKIVEDYNKERENIESYNGRQLLEMLQNVDDACTAAKSKKALIKLENNKLIIANNGEPFSEEGFISILNSNVSSKSKKQNKIGRKGLGFRSVLSWAEELTIHSAGTSIQFGKHIAEAFLLEITQSSPAKFKQVFESFSHATLPIAILRAPTLLGKFEKPIKEFDTVIEITLLASVVNDVQTQIRNLINKETLLFLNHLKVIEIDTPQIKKIFTKRTHKDSRITVESLNLLNEEKDLKTWTLNSLKGKHRDKNYELTVAWTHNLDDVENVIYSHFKTRIQFRFPALIHGTFELSPDRNQLVKDTFGHNEFLITKLVELLVNTALLLGSKDERASYRPLQLLHIDFENLDSMFKEFNFQEKLIEEIKKSKIFPTVNGTYCSYVNEPVYYENPIAEILRGKDVKGLLQHCSNKETESFLISVFSPSHYPLERYVSIIHTRLDKLTSPEFAKLIFHLFTYEPYKKELSSKEFDLLKLKSFVPDSNGKPISWKTENFLPTEKNKFFKLPKSIELKFVNVELLQNLLLEFDVSSFEDLYEHFAYFSIRPFSFNDIALTLIKYYREKTELSLSDVQEFHSYLFSLFDKEESLPNVLSEEIKVPVISINRKVTDAHKVYFGTEYDNHLLSELYNFDKTKLLAASAQFNLEEEGLGKLKKYFRWLGVAVLPRYVVGPLQRYSDEFDSFAEHVLRHIDYKKPISDHQDSYRNYQHLNSELLSTTEINVGHFDDLKNILAKTKIETIFNWINQDENLKKTLEENREILTNTSIYLDIRLKQYLRHIRYFETRSYARWLFSNISWLPVESNKNKREPDRCCLSKTITLEFSPFVEKPKVNFASLADKLSLPEDTLEAYLVNVGVHREIRDFPTSRLYEMLLALPTADEEGKVAKSIYREVVTNFDENRLDTNHPAYQTFLTEGQILCDKNRKTNYFPISEAYYIDTKIFGDNILQHFPIACFDKKKGTQKVRKLFGVQQLQNISFKLNEEPEVTEINVPFQEDIQNFKGLVYALRMHQDEKHTVLNRIKQLKITLCKKIKAEFIHENHNEPFDLEEFEFIPYGERLSFFVSVPSYINSYDELRDNVTFCESIAEIFTTVIQIEEHREFIHDLYAKNAINRGSRLQSYLQWESDDYIREAYSQLNIIDDIRLSFWRAFAIASRKNFKVELNNENGLNAFLEKRLKLSEADIRTLLPIETYSFLSEIDTQALVYKLFMTFEVDYKSFRRHFSALDLGHFFKNQFEDTKLAFRTEFEHLLYESLVAKDTKEKTKVFELIDRFNELNYSVEDGFLGDVKSHFVQKISQKFSLLLVGATVDFSLDKLILQNRIDFEKNENVRLVGFLERRDVQALLLFNEVEKLKSLLSAESEVNNFHSTSKSQKLKIQGKDVDFEDYVSLKEQVLEGVDFSKFKIRIGKTLSVNNEDSESRRSRGSGHTRNFDSRNEEAIGFIAELYCFKLLCEKYGEANVRWVSENSFRANAQLTGEAGVGYDFELNESGNVRYIEVKGIASPRDGFRMTSNEVKKALEFPDKYDLLIVENPLSIKPEFKFLKQPFKYRRDESFLFNSRFTIHSDRYLVKFKWRD